MQLEDKINKYRSIERRLIELRNAKNEGAVTIRNELLASAHELLKTMQNTLHYVPYAVYAPDAPVYVLVRKDVDETIVFQDRDGVFGMLEQVDLTLKAGNMVWQAIVHHRDPITFSIFTRDFPIAYILKGREDCEKLVKEGVPAHILNEFTKETPDAANP